MVYFITVVNSARETFPTVGGRTSIWSVLEIERKGGETFNSPCGLGYSPIKYRYVQTHSAAWD